jgi:hypothetical protein
MEQNIQVQAEMVSFLHTVWPEMRPNKEKVRLSSLIAVHRDSYHERFPFLATGDNDKALCLNRNTCFLYMFLNVPETYKCMQVTSSKAQLILQLSQSVKTHNTF